MCGWGVGGGSMAEWSVHWTHNPAVPGWSPAWPLAGFVLGLSEFKFSATLVSSQLVASDPSCCGF